MKTLQKILSDVRAILSSTWTARDSYTIPRQENLTLATSASKVECAILYADIRGSSQLVKTYKSEFAAKMYKIFLRAACDVIRKNEGEIVSFDGDRVMAAFCGSSKCSNAAKTGLQINATMINLNEIIAEKYTTTKYRLDYAIGIDVSDLFVIKTGIRGSNDLAWIGTAANNAAKLSELRSYSEKTFITKRVFDRLNESSKYNSAKTQCMWEPLDVKVMDEPVLGSSWFWRF